MEKCTKCGKKTNLLYCGLVCWECWEGKPYDNYHTKMVSFVADGIS